MLHEGERKIESAGDEIYKEGADYCRQIKCVRCKKMVVVRSAKREALAEVGDYVCGNCTLIEKGLVSDTESEAA